MPIWLRKLLAFGAVLLGLTILFSTRSKTLDLLLIAVLVGGRVILGTVALTQFRVHRNRDGSKVFRYRPRYGITFYGLPARWHRWLLGEPGTSRLER